MLGLNVRLHNETVRSFDKTPEMSAYYVYILVQYGVNDLHTHTRARARTHAASYIYSDSLEIQGLNLEQGKDSWSWVSSVFPGKIQDRKAYNKTLSLLPSTSFLINLL